MSKVRRSKRPAKDAPARSDLPWLAPARLRKEESLWQTVVESVPGNRVALRFFATFGILTAVYFTATLDLKLNDPQSSGTHSFAAELAAMNQWARHTLLEPYQRGIAKAAAALLGGMGHDAKAQGREIHSPGFAVAVTSGCDAIEPTLLLGVAMLSFPALVRQKFAGLLVGATALAALNVVRVVTLWLIGRHWHDALDVAHFTIWPFLIIVFALFVFIRWLRHVAPARGRRTGMERAT